MKKKIVIIGNGFDLRHFLPTKYNHLITILRDIENLDFCNNEVSFFELFGGNFRKKDEKFYEGILEFYDTSKIEFSAEELIAIQSRLKNNNWFQFLKTVEDSEIETWIDFEIEINRVLKTIGDFFINYKIIGQGNRLMQDGNGDNIVFYINQVQNNGLFKNRIQSDILANFGLFDLENDNVLVASKKFLFVIENEIQYFKEKDFFDNLYYSLEDFTGIFNDYIVNVVDSFYPNFKEQKRENFIKQKHNLFNNIHKVYCFNYTKTFFEFYYDILSENFDSFRDNYEPKIEFVHGKSIGEWDKDLEKLKIVLGVNEISDDLKSHKLFQFTKYFQKLHKNTDYLFLDKIIKNFANIYKGKDEYIFYFWGHSLDSSDSEYLKDVFKVVLEDNSEIKIFYHSIAGKADQLKNLLNIIDKDIIEGLMKNKRLVFIESTPENLFTELS